MGPPISREGDVPHRALHIFVAVVKAGGFAEAAAQFGVTPSAVSHQIRTLETWLGAQVFDRRSRRPKPTPLGQVLFDGAGEAVDRIGQVAAAVRRASSPDRVVVSAPPSFAAYRLVPAFEAVRRELPEAEIDLRLSRFDAPPETEAVDLAIRFLHGHPTAPALGQKGWSAVGTPALIQTLGNPTSARDISGAVLLHEEIYNFWPSCFAAAGIEAPTDARYMPFGDALHVLSAALSGAGLALLPREVTRDLWRRGTLLSIPGTDVEPDAGFHIMLTLAGERKANASAIMASLVSFFES